MQETAVQHASPPSGKQLRLLGLDGGGVRGLSSLLILQKVMEMIDPDDPPKPCDYFDIIGGTSTGGLIAIMLGRLKMTVQECIDEYKDLFSSIFTKKKHRVGWNGKIQGRFDHEALESGIKRVVEQKLGDTDALFKDDSHRTGFVCATSQETSEPVIISSYYSHRRASDLRNISRIWEVGRATSAAMSFFDPIKIGAAVFLDGGIGANNPIKHLCAEARDMFAENSAWRLEENILCLVSIGTGQPLLAKFGDSVLGTEILDALVKITTNTEVIANDFQQANAGLFEQGLAYRFNVEQGLENVPLEDVESVATIEEATRRYISIEKSNYLLRKCVRQLVLRESPVNLSAEDIKKFAFLSIVWESWNPFNESDLDLCFVPHTSAYVDWTAEGGILAYEKPPTRSGENFKGQIVSRIMASAIKENINRYTTSDHEPNSVLYVNCETITEAKLVLGAWILQLLALPIPVTIRQTLSAVLLKSKNVNPRDTLDNVLRKMTSDFTMEILRDKFLDMISGVQGPLFIGLENLDALANASQNSQAQKAAVRGSFVSLLMDCAQKHPKTYIVMGDTAALKIPPFKKDITVAIHRLQWNTEYRECLRTMDFERRLDRFKEIAPAEPGTVEWFWRHPTYTWWRDRQSGILWIQGKPGSGKSVLAKNILEPASASYYSKTGASSGKTLSQETGTRICEWYYSTRGGDELMAHISLLRSLLYQLLSGNDHLFGHFKAAYRRYIPNSCDWVTLENLKGNFRSIADAGISALCLVDAMDESEDDKSKVARKHILSFFASVVSRNENSHLKFLILSRPEHDIERFFTLHQRNHNDLGVIRLHEANEEAIRIIINAGMDSLDREMRPTEYSDEDDGLSFRRQKKLKPRRRNRGIQTLSDPERDELNKIKQFLLKYADGVILWITVTIATVKSLFGETFYTWSEVRKVLEDLPTDLTELYKRIVEEIHNRLSSQQLEIARKILMWTAGANNWKSLRIFELREAINLSQRQDEFETIVNIRWEDFRYRLRRYCGPFIDIVPFKRGETAIYEGQKIGSNPITRFDKVQLLHRTVKDFLADSEVARELYFDETQATTLVLDTLRDYHNVLRDYLAGTRFEAAIKGTLRGNTTYLIQELVYYIDDRALLLWLLSQRRNIPNHPIDIAGLFVKEPLRLLGITRSSMKLSNPRVRRAIEESWFSGKYTLSPDFSRGDNPDTIPLLALHDISHIRTQYENAIGMFVCECLYNACLEGRVTAVELLLQLSLEFGKTREESPGFFSQMVHSLLSAAVELGIEDLSSILSNMSLSVHNRQTEVLEQNTFEQRTLAEIGVHKLWERRTWSGRQGIFANHLEILAAETGQENLMKMMMEQTDDILRPYSNLYQSQADDEKAGLLRYAEGFNFDDDVDTQHDQDSRMALELGIDHLKLTFDGFRADDCGGGFESLII